MEQSRPLSLNPFQGYSEDERNMLTPRCAALCALLLCSTAPLSYAKTAWCWPRAATSNFDEKDVRVPLGLGSRHMAAAGMTHETEAIAVVVSQTSGAVRVFRHGRAVLELSSRIRPIVADKLALSPQRAERSAGKGSGLRRKQPFPSPVRLCVLCGSTKPASESPPAGGSFPPTRPRSLRAVCRVPRFAQDQFPAL